MYAPPNKGVTFLFKSSFKLTISFKTHIYPFKRNYCHGLLKNSHAPAEDRTGDPSIYSLVLYHVAIKAGLYRKAVQVYYIPNLYPVTFSPSILNSSSNSQKYKNHWKRDLRSSNAHVGYFRWAPFVTDS